MPSREAEPFSSCFRKIDLTPFGPGLENPGGIGRPLWRHSGKRDFLRWLHAVAFGRTDPVFVPDVQQLPAMLQDMIRPNDVLVTLGAGNIGQVAATLPQVLATRRAG